MSGDSGSRHSRSGEIVPCFSCARSTGHPGTVFPGLKGDAETVTASVCSPECYQATVRFTARRSAQRGPAAAGFMVGALGMLAGTLFLLTGRELGRILIVVGLFGAGTTRIGYTDAIPDWLARRVGFQRATVALQWGGIVACFAAVALALFFLFR